MAKKLPKMIDMAMTPAARAKDAMPAMSGMVDAPDKPVYPWGLCLRLGEEEIAKLGIGDDAAVDDMMELTVLAKITSVSTHESTTGKNRSIELQVTHIEDDDDAPEVKNTAKSLYKKG